MNLNDYIIKIKKLARDDSGYLSDEDFTSCLDSALIKLSKDCPKILDYTFTGNNGYDYNLPEGWVDGFSFVQALEYPLSNSSAEYLEADQFLIYQDEGTKKLRIMNIQIPETEKFKIYYSSPYRITLTENNVPNNFSKAVIYLAAFFACQILAVKMSEFIEMETGSDIKNFYSQSEKMRKAGAEYYGNYENLLFNKTAGISGFETRAALVSKPCNISSDDKISFFH